jgi:hypothetical protein
MVSRNEYFPAASTACHPESRRRRRISQLQSASLSKKNVFIPTVGSLAVRRRLGMTGEEVTR